MKISVINSDGTTVYTDSIERNGNVIDESFATTLSQQTAKLYNVDNANTYGTLNDDGSRTMTLNEIFEEASSTYGVDINLLKAVAQEESYFKADATSSAGAMGIMQLMPKTAEAMGVENAYDAYQNIMGGAKLLGNLLQRYNGDQTLALAAYSAGGGAVDRYGGVPPFSETQNMIKKVEKILAEGANVPNDTYTVTDKGSSIAITTDGTLTREQAAFELAKALADFPNHSSYSEFLSQMNEITNTQDLATDDSDAYVAYERLLNNANSVIKNMLGEN